MEADVEEILIKKEDEWRQALASKFEALNAKLKRRDSEIHNLNDKFMILKKDFLYNLGLLDDRDKELEYYEHIINDMNHVVLKKTEDVSKLEMKLNEQEHSFQNLNEEYKLMEHEANQQLSASKREYIELQRQFKMASKEWADEMKSQLQIYKQQILILESKFQYHQREVESHHADSISRLKSEHSLQLEKLKSILKEEKEQVKNITQHTQMHQFENNKLQTKITELELRLRENQAIYESEIREMGLSRQKIEHGLVTVYSKLKETYQLLHRQSVTQNSNTKYECNISNTTDVTEVNNNQENVKQTIINMETMLVEINEKITQYESMKSVPPVQLMKNNLENSEENQYEIINTQHDEFQQLKQQNTVMREIIKELKRKIQSGTHTTEETNIKSVIMPTNSKPIILFQQNEADKINNVEFDNLHKEVNVSMYPGVEREPGTTTKEHTNLPMYEIKSGQGTDTELHSSSLHCQKCKFSETKPIFQQETMKEMLKTLTEKVETLINEVESKDDEYDECHRIQQLEDAIGCLKSRMLNELHDTFNGENDDCVMTLSDIRMMLLEQKLDHVTDIIGQRVSSEKNLLLQAMQDVKVELVSKLQDGKKQKHSHNTNSESICEEQGNTLKSDDMLEKIKEEIGRLECNLYQRMTNNTSGQCNEEKEHNRNITKAYELNGVCSHQHTQPADRANNSCFSPLDFDSHTNLLNNVYSHVSHPPTHVCPLTTENNQSNNTQVTFRKKKHSKEDIIKKPEELTKEITNRSPCESDMQRVWDLLKDTNQTDIPLQGPLVTSAMLHPMRSEVETPYIAKKLGYKKTGNHRQNAQQKIKIRDYSMKE